MSVIEFPDSFDRIDISHAFIGSDSNDARKTQRISASVSIALLNAVERNLQHHDRCDETKPSKIFDGMLLEEFRHLRNLAIRQSRIRFPDVQQLSIVLHGKRVIG